MCEGTEWVAGPFLGKKGEKYCENKDCGAGTKQESKACKYCGGKNFLAGANPIQSDFLIAARKSKDIKANSIFHHFL